VAGVDDAVTLPEDLSEILRHLESCYPEEGCGVLLRAAGEGAWRVRPLRNALASRTAYAFDPHEWLQVLLDAERRDERLLCVFHSHVEGGVEFSHEDRRQAAPGGQPLLPGVSYLVVAVQTGRAVEMALYRWDGAAFARAPCQEPPRGRLLTEIP
jgi:[CysO sulfur-carrier protein]-S-L-cysteine hydrolase